MPKTITPTTPLRRVTLNFPPADYKRLVSMAQRRGITVTELLRRSVSLQAYLDDMLGSATDVDESKAKDTVVGLQHLR
jgi:hypothetical protein